MNAYQRPSFKPLSAKRNRSRPDTNSYQPYRDSSMAGQSKLPHVVIIGAGIGGLFLAQFLRKQGVSFDVFERDASASARGQGFALGLHMYATIIPCHAIRSSARCVVPALTHPTTGSTNSKRPCRRTSRRCARRATCYRSTCPRRSCFIRPAAGLRSAWKIRPRRRASAQTACAYARCC